ncbi:ATP-dependent RNA helicase dbp10 [Lobosporangium transversale]|uniref:RNA helicase n=1 Tax=Lobosporangium transversale TaxID=64571 RepID=A0A1Y2GLH8_9FUNG|nr:P-loop containing nucleoside triphosphate hydrolase protein [Lobosporangium transversale]KAF9913756.1 ATP-dependent RNA helicase dbp10 [Lobosporangium transversale]ORZ14866.1 P-loop containing nucleoside triphosphate hydrolase protein [Lobosporangium transversale]|eukprot:XP_021880998.1 P-loop containing nucleoside triphosphate hydrolase protein [Lobosporangium transversale]
MVKLARTVTSKVGAKTGPKTSSKAAVKGGTKSSAGKKNGSPHYRKGKKAVKDDEEEEASEIEEVAMSDSDVDMEDSLVPRKKPMANLDLDDLMGVDLEEEEEFIANANMAANKKHKKSGGFQSMGLSFPIYKAILHKGFKVPTPIQRKCIPLIMEGGDVVGMARTGSGKTAAFLIPMLEKLKSHSAKVGARAVIMSPSRELAMQTQKVCKELGKHTDLRSCILVGGDSLEDQFAMLAANPDILIATPGRLLHLIVEMDLDLKSVQYIVFDEADRLFEMGFEVQLHEILHRLQPNRQTLLFSATLPKLLVDFAKAGLQEPTLVRLDVDTKISKDLEMAFFSVKQQDKEAALLTVLRNIIKLPLTTGVKFEKTEENSKKRKVSKDEVSAATEHQTIVFVSTKHHVEYISNILKQAGYQVSFIYGSLDQAARKIQIDRFRKGYTNLLVVTDVAARGIDIPVLENVINYDFVDNSKVFIHRVGRTARAGKKGWAYSLITPEELPYLIDLQLFLARKMIVGCSSEQGPDYTSDIVIGALPNSLLEIDSEWVKNNVLDDTNLQALRGVSVNGYKLYCKSRPAAAVESYKRAKEIVAMDEYAELNPLFADLVDDEEKKRVDLIASISNFRPTETIFEVGQRGIKGATQASTVMKTRREVVDKVISMARQKKAGLTVNLFPSEEGEKGNGEARTALGPEATEAELEDAFKRTLGLSKKRTINGTIKEKPTSFKDEAYYMSHTQLDNNTERGYSMVNTKNSFLEQAANATMNLNGDDRDTMSRTKNTIKWDARKKKFVKGLGIGADNKKLITTESGNKISASFKSGRFSEWQQKTKTSLPRTGEMELPSSKAALAAKRFRHTRQDEAKPLDPLAYDYERKLKRAKFEEKEAGAGSSKNGRGGSRGGRGGSMPRSELKSATTIAKERLAKEKRREKTGRHAGSKVIRNSRGGGGGSSRGGRGSSRGGGRGTSRGGRGGRGGRR